MKTAKEIIKEKFRMREKKIPMGITVDKTVFEKVNELSNSFGNNKSYVINEVLRNWFQEVEERK